MIVIGTRQELLEHFTRLKRRNHFELLNHLIVAHFMLSDLVETIWLFGVQQLELL